MTKLLRIPVATVLLMGVLAGCQATSPDLGARTFISVGIVERGVPKALVPGTEITIDFKVGGFSASAGCNSMGGEFRMENGRFVVSDMSSTDMGCDPARMAQDDWLAQVLRARPALTLLADDLTIQTDAVVLRLRDRTAVVPNRPLAGPRWVVESIFNGETVTSAPAGVVATIVFRADGTIDVDDGCNRGSGTWQPSGAGVDDPAGSGIEISELGMTKKACPGAAGELENTVLATLRADSIVVTISGDRLLLRGGATTLGLRAG